MVAFFYSKYSEEAKTMILLEGALFFNIDIQ